MTDHPVTLMEGNRLYAIETDHLGTPRSIFDRTADKTVWRWDITGEAFGADAPDEDPDGDGVTFTFDLRFPGQRFDGATGLHYNYQRYCDPTTGRYIQSDPIGPVGGLSTYAHVYVTRLSSRTRGIAEDPSHFGDLRAPWPALRRHFGDDSVRAESVGCSVRRNTRPAIAADAPWRPDAIPPKAR